MKVLVVDIGGSHVKTLATGQREPRNFDSSPDLRPDEMVRRVADLVRDWAYDVVALGVPAPVGPNGVATEPGNLGEGWVGFDFEKAFGVPVRTVNDAAMQALGAYDGGRMLFLGLGTGLGSTLVSERVVVPLELGCLRFSSHETMAERLGKAGLEWHGEQVWRESVSEAVALLRQAVGADYVALGGGNAERVHPLPEGARRGGNEDAFTGGFRLWEELVEPQDRPPRSVWRVVR